MPLLTTSDGSTTIYSDQYGVTYHSIHGAVTESAHVFINAGLRYKAVVQQDIAILETGFGTGLNAFLTKIEAERRNLNVRYTGLEIQPIQTWEAAELDYAEALLVPEQKGLFLSLHQCAWEEFHELSDNFTFQKCQTPIQEFLAEEKFDIIYFDAFAPQAQPELWTEAVFAHMYASLKPDGVLVTYCAQGAFKRTLKKVGFTVERLEGPPGKREMTRATK